jgi:Mg-chelatase subunit ChlI
VQFFSLIKDSNEILYPLSQRAIATFTQWCRAHAYLQGRDYVTSQDWEVILENFLLHRLELENNSGELLHDLYTRSFRKF